jgi:hypothetical protein
VGAPQARGQVTQPRRNRSPGNDRKSCSRLTRYAELPADLGHRFPIRKPGDKAHALFHYRTRFPRHPHLPQNRSGKCNPCVRYVLSPMSRAARERLRRLVMSCQFGAMFTEPAAPHSVQTRHQPTRDQGWSCGKLSSLTSILGLQPPWCHRAGDTAAPARSLPRRVHGLWSEAGPRDCKLRRRGEVLSLKHSREPRYDARKFVGHKHRLKKHERTR